MLVPSGIAFDNTTRLLFAEIAESNRLIRLYDFENKKIYFSDVHASFKYCILNFGGSQMTTSQADYIFFVHRVEELEDRARHIALNGEDIHLVNPNTRTCPIFRTRRDAEITKSIYRRIPVLVDEGREGPTGNPWGQSFKRMFDQSNDAELFRDSQSLQGEGFVVDGTQFVKGEHRYLQLYEAKMFRPYDHRFGSAFDDTSNWTNQGQTAETTLVQHQNPEFRVSPRWWVDKEHVISALSPSRPPALLTFRDITRATDHRTFIATMLPLAAVIHKAPVIRTSTEPHRELCLLANLNSIPLDFCTKQKSGGISLTFFIVKQLPVLPPDTYDKPCPWERHTTLESWISERVLKLTCTAEDMLPLAEACDFTSGSFQSEYGGRLNKWDEAERAELRAELDAAFFHLYGIGRDDVEYILSTFKGIHDQRTLLPGHVSVAERIVQKYAEMSFPS